MIHLDTSFLIRALVRHSRQDRELREWLRAGEPLGISTIGWTEFLCGPVESHHVKLAARFLPERFPFVEEDTKLAATLFNESGRRRGSLLDCMVAATAIRLDAPLATANPTDFRRFETTGLKVISA